MGAYMAGNLLEADHELVVHNRTRTKAERLAQHGARVADSPREVAETSDVVITMLPGPAEVEEVVAGEGGLLEGATRGSLVVDMSTSSPLRWLTPPEKGVWGRWTLLSPAGTPGPGMGRFRSWSEERRTTSRERDPSSRSWARRSST